MNPSLVTIGDAARASDVSAKMIRHYEKIGLVQKPKRTDSGYRIYSDNEIHVFRFIKQSRNLGFSTKQTTELLGLWQNRKRSSSKVKKLAIDHIRELDERIREMQTMKATLEHLAASCRGDERPDCPILNRLASASDPMQAFSAREDRRLRPVSRKTK
jgi:Cu(I)-responsive transcriptional regulator